MLSFAPAAESLANLTLIYLADAPLKSPESKIAEVAKIDPVGKLHSYPVIAGVVVEVGIAGAA